MKNLFKIELAVLFFAGAVTTSNADIVDSKSERLFSIASASSGVVFPRAVDDNWVLAREQRRSGDTAVYYTLQNEKEAAMFSVFIDKTVACNTSAECLELALKNTAYKAAKDLARGSHGSFQFATFYLEPLQNKSLKQSHVLASALVDGVWFDVHLSKVSEGTPDIGYVKSLLERISVKPK